MAMDVWYDLRLQEIFDLRDRTHELLDEVQGLDAAPASSRRVCDLFDFTDPATDLPKEVTDNS